jgi:hypothetical protein
MVMNLKLTKFKLRLAAALMGAASALVVAVALLMPVAPAASSVEGRAFASITTRSATTESAAPGTDFSDLLDVSLSKPLVDVRPPARPLPVAGAASVIGLRLTGTIVEPMHSYAVFTDPAGKTEIKSVGDLAGGSTISAINPDSVTLQYMGRSMVLHAVKPPSLGGPGL